MSTPKSEDVKDISAEALLERFRAIEARLAALERAAGERG